MLGVSLLGCPQHKKESTVRERFLKLGAGGPFTRVPTAQKEIHREKFLNLGAGSLYKGAPSTERNPQGEVPNPRV